MTSLAHIKWQYKEKDEEIIDLTLLEKRAAENNKADEEARENLIIAKAEKARVEKARAEKEEKMLQRKKRE